MTTTTGNDIINNTSADEILDGLAGEDTFVSTGNFDDYDITINFFYDNGTPNISITMTDINLSDGDDGTDTIVNFEKLQFADGTKNLVLGTDLDDDGVINTSLLGSSGEDGFFGFAGNDVIYGLGGGDLINGGRGDDILVGGADSDALEGAEGDDILIGGDSYSDTSPETDEARYAGNISGYFFTSGKTTIDTVGEVYYFNILDYDITNGDNGTDTLFGIEKVEFDDFSVGFFTGDGSDNTFDTATNGGTTESDVMLGFEGNDTFHLGNTNDVVFGGSDTGLADGSDIDTAVYSGNLSDYSFFHGEWEAANGFLHHSIFVEDSNGQFYSDILIDIDYIQFADQTVSIFDLPIGFIGGTGVDNMVGSDFNHDILKGLEGNDQLKGLAGDDFFIGGEGNDLLYGHSWGVAGDDDDIDTAVYFGNFSEYSISRVSYTNSSRTGDTIRYIIEDISIGGGTDGIDEGTDKLVDIDYLQFADKKIAVSDLSFITTGTIANDNLVGTEFGEILNALDGNDQLKGQAGNDILVGEQGNDQLFGHSWGDAGDADDIDTASYYGNFADFTITRQSYINSSRTESTIRYFVEDNNISDLDEGTDRLVDIDLIQFSDQTIDLSTFQFEVFGTSSNENFSGTSFDNDLLLGLAGNDKLKGLAGSDFFNGGEGNDQIYGHSWGNAGDINDIDTAIYDGNIWEYNITREVYTNSSRTESTIRYTIEDTGAGGGSDGVDEGTDTLVDIDFIQFANQTIDLSNHFFDIFGTSNNDNISGTNLDNDLIWGLNGNDQLKGLDGSDDFVGGEGDDEIFGRSWGDAGDAGDIDTAYYDGLITEYDYTTDQYTNSGRGGIYTTRTFVEDITPTSGLLGIDEGTDRLVDIDILYFFNGMRIEVDAMVIGDDTANNLVGDTRDNFITAKAGNDELKGLAGNDIFNGGEGNDKIYGYSWGNAGSPDDIDTVVFNGVVSEYSFSYDLYTNSGRNGEYTLRLFVEDVAIGGGSDGIDEGRDQLIDIDFIQFGDGVVVEVDAIVVGDSSSNTLVGDERNNIIIGESGADILAGGDGFDTFYFKELTDSTDTDKDFIADFTQGDDQIALFELGVDFSDLNITDDGSNTTVGINGTNFEVELNGVFNLTQDDFLL